MSNVRYLEIDSTYRDRNLYPLPAQFDIPISQTGRKGPLQAVDPYSNDAVIARWIGNNFQTDTLGSASITVAVDLAAGIGTTTSSTTIIVDAAPGRLQTKLNYYLNAIISDASGGRRRITYYKHLGDGRAEITLETNFATVLVNNAVLVIQDPSEIATHVNGPLIFVPDGRVNENAYANHILFNETLNEFRQIIGYDSITHLVSLNVGSNNTIATTWLITHVYSIRKESPIIGLNLNGTVISNSSFSIPNTNFFSDLEGGFLEKGDILTAGQRTGALVAGGTSSVQLSVGSVAIDGFYIGYNIEMISGAAIGQVATITGYTAAGFIATIFPSFSLAAGVGDTYVITANTVEARRIVKYVDFRGLATGGTVTSITFPSSASLIDGFYNNLYVDAGASGIRLITNYVASTRIATVSVAFGAAPVAGQAFTITSGIVSLPFSGSLFTNKVYILAFTADNLSPFVYTGSQVSQQEMVCYEVQLLSLILPNQVLKTGQGGRIAFYPYVYVELANVSGAGAGLSNTIYSNNPNSTKMIFRVAIDDINNPLVSSFIKLDGNGMIQTIKFKPNDNLRFSVHLSNGDLFDTIIDETYSPNSPNALIQISALFGLKRL